MTPKTRLDYVKLYAERLRVDNSLFKQQKMLIDSQIKGSSDLTRKRFGTGSAFKTEARKHLIKIGLLSDLGVYTVVLATHNVENIWFNTNNSLKDYSVELGIF